MTTEKLSQEGIKSFLQAEHIIFLPAEKKNLASIYASTEDAGVTILSQESMDCLPGLQDFVLLKVSVSSPLKIFVLGVCCGVDKAIALRIEEERTKAADELFKNNLS